MGQAKFAVKAKQNNERSGRHGFKSKQHDEADTVSN